MRRNTDEYCKTPAGMKKSRWNTKREIYDEYGCLHFQNMSIRSILILSRCPQCLGSSANMTDWTTGLSRFDPRQRQRIFPLTSVSRPALGPTQPVQWVPGVLSPGVKRGRGVTLTTHPHLVSRSRMSRSYTSPRASP
jgi:hypothetical protein